MSRTKARPRPGGALLEVLALLAVTGVTLALIAPALAPNDARAVDRAARDLLQTLKAAQADAVSDGQTVQTRITPAARRIEIRRAGRAPMARLLDPNVGLSALGATAEPPSEEGDKSLPRRVVDIWFFPDGSSTGGAVDLTRGAETRRVAIDWASGALSIEPAPP